MAVTATSVTVSARATTPASDPPGSLIGTSESVQQWKGPERKLGAFLVLRMFVWLIGQCQLSPPPVARLSVPRYKPITFGSANNSRPVPVYALRPWSST